MMFRKIAGPFRIDSNDSTTPVSYRLKGTAGGRVARVVQYMIKVYTASPDAEVGLVVEHGPDGEIYTPLASAIGAQPVTNLPGLLVGAVGNTDSNSDVVGEWVLPTVTIQRSSGGMGPQFATVEVWELRKM